MSLPVFPYGKLSFAVSLALCSAYSFATEVENTQPQERVDLPTVTVQGVGKQTTSNYTIPASSAATGIRLIQRETPQSLSVVTEKQMDDQGLDTLQDVLKQTPGVFHSKWATTYPATANLFRAVRRLTAFPWMARLNSFTTTKPSAAAPTTWTAHCMTKSSSYAAQAVCPTAVWASRAVRLLWNAKTDCQTCRQRRSRCRFVEALPLRP